MALRFSLLIFSSVVPPPCNVFLLDPRLHILCRNVCHLPSLHCPCFTASFSQSHLLFTWHFIFFSLIRYVSSFHIVAKLVTENNFCLRTGSKFVSVLDCRKNFVLPLEFCSREVPVCFVS
jgi:hypothetical protein